MTLCNVPIEAFSETDIKEDKIDAIFLATYTAQRALAQKLSIYEKEIEILKLYLI